MLLHWFPIHSALLDVHKEVFLTFNVDAVIKEVDENATRVFNQAIFYKVSRTPIDRLPSLKGDFDSLYAIIVKKRCWRQSLGEQG